MTYLLTTAIYIISMHYTRLLLQKKKFEKYIKIISQTQNSKK